MYLWSNFTINTFNKIKKIDYNDLFINKLKLIKSDINNTDNVKYTCSPTQISINIINKLKSSIWVSQKLKYDYLPYEINIKWGNNNNIYIKTTKNKFNSFSKRLPIFLKIINYINKNNKDIEIYLVLSNLKKNINPKEIILPDHVNSGYTNTLTNIIFIWREEEFEKVCFHEIIHLLDQDHRHEELNITSNLKGPENFYEAITDYKAIIYNTIYLSIITKINIKKIFCYEYSFIKNQAYFIYNKLNIDYKQKSPAYSYYILKYIIFYYFNNNFDKILFNDIFYNNIHYNKLIKLIKKNKFNDDDDNNIYINLNSARMTLFELH
jgi:hypothetical protein